MARRLTILAGSGPLVDHVVAAALAAGDAVQIVAFLPRSTPEGVALLPGDVTRPDEIIRSIVAFASTHVALAGAIQLNDRHREGLARFAAGTETRSEGDAAISAVAEAIQRFSGASIIGAQEIAADLLAQAGHIAGPAAAASHLDSARLAMDAARQIGRLDLGQAVVVAGGRVVAAEDVGGTDELLARVAEHRRLGRLGDGSGALVLAKAAKPQQPMYVDLPAIGPQTIVNASSAGIALIAVDPGKSLVLERQALMEEADRLGLAVVGLADA